MSEEAERIINGFKNSMFKGKDVHRMSASGPGKCKVQLDEDVTTLYVAAPPSAQKRAIPLETIEQIMVGPDGEEVVDFGLDDLTVTLQTEEGEPVSLRFKDMEARDTFALCLGMFVDQVKGGGEEEYDEDEDYEEEEEEEEPPAPEPAPKKKAQSPAVPAKPPASIPPIPTSPTGARPSARDSDAGTEAASTSRSSMSGRESTSSKLSSQQRLMKKFVEKAVKGRTLQMLATTGAFVEVMFKLNRDITSISIQRAGRPDGKQRVVYLRDVIEIGVGADAAHTEVRDDLICTLLLEGETAIAFRFDDIEERNTFSKCLQTLVTGNRREQLGGKRTSL